MRLHTVFVPKTPSNAAQFGIGMSLRLFFPVATVHHVSGIDSVLAPIKAFQTGFGRKPPWARQGYR